MIYHVLARTCRTYMDSPDWPPGEQHSDPSGTSLHSLGGRGMDTSLWTNTAVLETMSSSSQTLTVNKGWTHTDIAAWSGVQWSALALTSPHAQSSSIVAHPSTTIYKRSRSLIFCFCLTFYCKQDEALLFSRLNVTLKVNEWQRYVIYSIFSYFFSYCSWLNGWASSFICVQMMIVISIVSTQYF